MAHTLDNAHEFFPLPLSTAVATDASLDEFQSTLFTVVLQQFQNASFIRSKSHDFTHKAAGEFGLFSTMLKKNIESDSRNLRPWRRLV